MDYNVNPIKILLSQKSDPDKIIDYLIHPNDQKYELTPALQDKLDKMRDCRDLIKKHGSRVTVVPILMTEFNVSHSEAVRIYSETLEVFNATSSTSGRDFYVDMLLGFMIETRNKAYIKQDYNAAARSEKNMLDLISQFMGNEDAKIYETIQPPDILYEFNPELLGVKLPEDLDKQIEKLLKKKKGDTSMFDDAEVVDE